jgi:hypothetical protein
MPTSFIADILSGVPGRGQSKSKGALTSVVRSEVFPGLWLNVPAMLAFDGASVLKTLNEGIGLPEHVVFVAKLAQTL